MTLKWHGDDVIARTRRGAGKGLVVTLEAMRNEAIHLILDTAKSGRIYRTGGVEHQASAPGEPPASDTGRLTGSITTDFDFDKLVGTLTARTEYAAYLEFGTQTMEARPFMRPAVANVLPRIKGIFEDAIYSEFK